MVSLRTRHKMIRRLASLITIPRIILWRLRSNPVRVAMAAVDALPAGRLGGLARSAVRAAVRNRVPEEPDLDDLAVLEPRPIPRRPRRPVPGVRGRVLHLVTNALPYTNAGYTVRTHRIVTAQRTAGLDPHVVTGWGWPMLQGHFGAAPRAEIDGVPYHRLLPAGRIPESGRGRMIRGAAEVTELVARIRPSFLHVATDHRNGSVALAVGERTGLPVIYEVRGFLEESWLSRTGDAAVGADRHRLGRERETRVMLEADAVVTLAVTMREDIVSRGVPREKVHIAPNAVDASLLTARPDGAGFRERHDIGRDQFVVGSVSTLAPHEGFPVLLRAAAHLRDRGAAVCVLLVGDGPERPALVRLARELGVDAVLPGRVSPDEALAAQASLDVFVAPRLDLRVCRLVTPLKPVEAMALGIPVVASDLPALRELVGGAGDLVPAGDDECLAKALAVLRDDPDRRARLAAAGRDEVAERRTWAYVTELYRELYTKYAYI